MSQILESFLPKPKAVKGKSPAPTEATVPFTQLKAAFFHGFDFVRVVIDEFHFVDEEVQMVLQNISSRSKWVISGTAALRDFADVKTVAKHLDGHLGIDNDGDIPTENKRIKSLRSDFTSAEQFQKYQPPYSDEWYQNRHKLAQRFLDRFSRRNLANYKVPMEESLNEVKLKHSQKYLYDQTRAMVSDPPGRRMKYDDENSEFRVHMAENIIRQADMGPPDALSRACTSLRTLERVFNGRFLPKAKKDLCAVENPFLDLMADLIVHEQLLQLEGFTEDEVDSVWQCFREAVEAIGDSTAKEALVKMYCSITWHNDEDERPAIEKRCNLRMETAYPQSRRKSRRSKARTKDLEPLCDQLRKEIKEAIDAYLPCFWEVRRYTLADKLESGETFTCDVCKEEDLPPERIRLVRCCGHPICKECYRECEEVDAPPSYDVHQGKHKYCPVDQCKAQFHDLDTIRGTRFDISCMPKKCRKLRKMLNILLSIPKTDQAIIFVQQRDMLNLVANILERNGLTCAVGLPRNHNAIPSFTRMRAENEVPEKKILLLQLGTETGAGL